MLEAPGGAKIEAMPRADYFQTYCMFTNVFRHAGPSRRRACRRCRW